MMKIVELPGPKEKAKTLVAQDTDGIKLQDKDQNTILTADASGVTIEQDLTVKGSQTTVQSSTLQITDKNVEVAVPTSGSGTDAAADGAGLTVKATADKTIQWQQSTDAFHTSVGVRVAGALGVNCTTPERKLDVEDNSDLPQARITYTDQSVFTDLHTTSTGLFRIAPTSRTVQVDTGDANGGNLQFTKSGGVVSGGVSWDTGDKDVTVYSEADLMLGAGGSSAKMFIDNGGNVGVNTTSPDRKLDVEDDSDLAQLRLTYDASNTADLATTSNGTLRLSPTSRTVQVDTGDANGGNLQFTKSGGVVSGGVSWDTGDKDVTVYSEADLMLGAGGSSAKVFIDNGGNVGIGTTEPDEQLEITGRLHLGQTTAPSTTTDKLYNVSGSLYWNGTDIGSGGGSGDITAVSLTGDSGGALNVASGDAGFTVAGGTGITTSGSGTTLTVAGDNAAADGSTKGVCAFTAADFSASSGVISLSAERVQDIVGAMLTGNTETNITATYQDGDGTIDLVVSDDLSAYDNSSSGFLTAERVTVTKEATYAGVLTTNKIYFRRYPSTSAYNLQLYNSVANDATTIQNQMLTGYGGAAFLATRAMTLSKICATVKANAGSGQHTFRVWALKATPQHNAAYDGTTTLTQCGYVDLTVDGSTALTDNNTYRATPGITTPGGGSASISAGDCVVMGVEAIGGSSGSTSYFTITLEFSM